MKAPYTCHRLGRPRILIVGCGDVGKRCLAMLVARFRVFAMSRDALGAPALRALGAVPVRADLDRPASLQRVAALAPRILHLAPPPASGDTDTRTIGLLAALGRASAARRLQARHDVAIRASSASPAGSMRRPGPAMHAGTAAPLGRLRRRRTSLHIVPEPGMAPRPVLSYASTSGVYGDCGGALIDETRTPRPRNARAIRRVAAETALRQAGARGLIAARIMRIPGIYAAERLPLGRLQKGTPALVAADDVYTNHIHADDLAAIMCRALWRGMPQRVVHASDDTRLKMGDYFDMVARAYALRLPPRIARSDAAQHIAPALLSFMGESRQLDNGRLKRELGMRLRYPSVADFLAQHAPPARIA